MGSTVLLCGGAKIPKTGAEAAAGTARFSESPIRAASFGEGAICQPFAALARLASAIFAA